MDIKEVRPRLLDGLPVSKAVFSVFPKGLFLLFTLVFLQLFLQCVDGGVDGLLKSLALLAGKEVVAAQNEADVGDLVLRGVGVVELQRNLGIDHITMLGAKLFHFLGDEVFKFLVSLEVN